MVPGNPGDVSQQELRMSGERSSERWPWDLVCFPGCLLVEPKLSPSSRSFPASFSHCLPVLVS